MANDGKTPVTIITGFLGAGKTTLSRGPSVSPFLRIIVPHFICFTLEQLRSSLSQPVRRTRHPAHRRVTRVHAHARKAVHTHAVASSSSRVHRVDEMRAARDERHVNATQFGKQRMVPSQARVKVAYAVCDAET
jgi:hypothetical protein